jgi:hypothetical protein
VRYSGRLVGGGVCVQLLVHTQRSRQTRPQRSWWGVCVQLLVHTICARFFNKTNGLRRWWPGGLLWGAAKVRFPRVHAAANAVRAARSPMSAYPCQ